MSECLEIQERAYNKSFKSALSNLKCDQSIKVIAEMESNRTRDLKDLETECTDIKKCLANFTENIFSKDVQTHDIVEYKKNLVDIEKKISTLKMNISKQRQDLEQKEKELVDEIIALKKLVYETSTISIKSIYTSTLHSKVHSVSLSDDKEVEVFQSFLNKTGGHNGGWGNVEHGIFLHCWNKCYGGAFHEDIGSQNISIKLIKLIKKKLPVLSEEEIEAHRLWYYKYLTLKESQSRSIEMWKAMKEMNRFKKVSESQVEKIKSEDNLCKIVSSVKNISLEEWKINKQNEEQMILEQKALEAIHAKEKLFSKTKINQFSRQINKKWIEAKKGELEKAIKTNAELAQREKCKKASEANKKIKEYRQRDEMIVSFRKSLINRNINKFQTQKTVKGSLTKKPQRFLRSKYYELTEQWRRRISKNESTESILPNTKTVCGVDYLPKLGIPKWRQEMV